MEWIGCGFGEFFGWAIFIEIGLNLRNSIHTTGKDKPQQRRNILKFASGAGRFKKPTDSENSERLENSTLSGRSRGLASVHRLVQPFKTPRRFFGLGGEFPDRPKVFSRSALYLHVLCLATRWQAVSLCGIGCRLRNPLNK